MDEYHVQFQDNSGWRNCTSLSAKNGPERLLQEMKSAQACYPGYRIRVVDDNGRLIDSL